MRMRFSVFFVPLLLIGAFAVSATAQTITANSCSQSDVQKAFSSVTASTTTIVIPSCPSGVTWNNSNGTVSLTVPSGSSGLTVQGQSSCTGQGNPSGSTSGVVSCTDNTLILNGSSYNSSNDIPIFAVTTQTGVPFRMTGLSFQGNGTTQTYNGAIVIGGSSCQVRVDHNDFRNLNAMMLTVNSYGGCGVVDHNAFDYTSSVNIGFRIQGSGSNDWGGNYPWAAATSFGTQKGWWYFEDNYVQHAGPDCDRGGKFVMRYNTFTSASSGEAQFGTTHPTGEPGGAIRGCRAEEIYGNSFVVPSGTTMSQWWWISSGTAVFWNNTVTPNGMQVGYVFDSMRRSNATYSQSSTPNGWGYCGSAFDGTGSSWDQDATSASTGYRCLDQPGTGQSDLLTPGGNFPSIVNTVTGTVSWPHQKSEPVYDWSNDLGLVRGGTYFRDATNESGSFVANSDYYLWCNSSSATGCTSFDGSDGVGSGPLASMPSTGKQGVGYFATDQGSQGQLYVYNSSGDPAVYYTPLSYPHPLVSGLSANSNSQPSPPTGLVG